MAKTNIGELNGKYSVLFRLLLWAGTVFIPLATAGLVFASGSIVELQRWRVEIDATIHTQKEADELRLDINKRFSGLPNPDLDRRIIRLETQSEMVRNQLSQIAVDVAAIKATIVKAR